MITTSFSSTYLIRLLVLYISLKYELCVQSATLWEGRDTRGTLQGDVRKYYMYHKDLLSKQPCSNS